MRDDSHDRGCGGWWAHFGARVGAGAVSPATWLDVVQAGVEFRVLEKRPQLLWDQDRGLGLWPAAQRVLHHLGVAEALKPHTKLIPPAAYRSRRGAWLSRCSVQLE